MTATTTLDQTGTGSATSAGVRRHVVVPTTLGEVTLVAEGDALVGLYYAEHRPEPDRATFGAAADLAEDATLASAEQQLREYVAGSRESFELPVRPAGSDRARQVWDLVSAVPRGQTTTYAALGRAVGVGPRVAGQLVARNPLCLVVPCHRVVASDGRLTGYAGGVDRKRWLLELEGAVPSGPAVVAREPVASGPAGREESAGTGEPAPPGVVG